MLRDSFLEGIHSWESDASDVLLQAVVQPKIIRGQVRAVRWVRQLGPPQLVDQGPGQNHDVGRGIIHVDETPASDGTVGPPPHVCLVEPVKDGSEDMLIHCQGALHIFIVNQTLHVEEGHNHNFGCCHFLAHLRGSWLTCSKPFLALLLELRVIDIDPGLICGNNLVQDTWGVVDQLCPKVTDSQSPCLLCLCEQVWHPFYTLLLQFEVKFDDSLHGTRWNIGPEGMFSQCDAAVLRDKALNFVDFHHGAACLGLGCPWFVHHRSPP